MPQEDELTPTSPDNMEGDVPLLDHKSGMFRPVGEDLPVHTEEEMPVEPAQSESTQAVVQPQEQPQEQPSTPVIEASQEVPVVVEAPVAQEQPVISSENPPVAEEAQPEKPVVRDSGMGDPNTPSVAPTVVVPPVGPVKAHGTSRTRILLILVFFGALAFLGYKYWYAPSIEVPQVPEVPVDTGAMPAVVDTGTVASGTEAVATGEVVVATGEVVAENTGTAAEAEGPLTFTATDRSPIVSFQYPQGRAVTLSELNWLKSVRLYDDQEVLQAKLLVFGADQMEQHLLAQDALQSILVSEKPFINEGLAGSIGIYSGGVDPLIIPSISVLAQPVVLFEDQQNEVNYMLILEPNMHKEMFAILRSLRLP